jgi:adenosine deaminase
MSCVFSPVVDREEEMNIREFPKVELHCHLECIMDSAMVRDILQDDPTYPIDPGELERAYPAESFEDFIRWWDFIEPIDGELEYFYPILGRYIERLKAQKVVYSEVMISSSEIPRDKVEAVEKVGNFRDWVDQRESDEIQVEFMVAFGRSRPLERTEELADIILALHEAGSVVGIALGAEDREHPVKPLRKILARLHEAGLGIEIHAGEWLGPESVWDALEYGYPDRIGHGVSIFQDSRLLDVIQERRVHIEMCPTSNLKTGSISQIEEHPIGRARELDLNFSINTDCPGVFECSMESEYELLSEIFGFGDSDFQRIFTNSLEARF